MRCHTRPLPCSSPGCHTHCWVFRMHCWVLAAAHFSNLFAGCTHQLTLADLCTMRCTTARQWPLLLLFGEAASGASWLELLLEKLAELSQSTAALPPVTAAGSGMAGRASRSLQQQPHNSAHNSRDRQSIVWLKLNMNAAGAILLR